ncbi:MAG: hypothetical protein ABJV04_02865 [Aliiglaciecola sp.]|uniref:hypothetical protein n=1 Tax=Aliiglaciecola sp. TaxID=1872441 RepID=UPI00329A71F6
MRQEFFENCHIDSGVRLKALLGEAHCFVFTFTQKFKGDEKGNYLILLEPHDIIVISDEAPRN